MPNLMINTKKGFTLIELMVVLTVLGILAAIVYPNYSEHLRKGRRAAAQAHLMEIAQQQQQYLLDARSYADSLTTLGIVTPSDVSGYYDIQVSASSGPPPSFTITATPKSGSAQSADVTLSIDNTGKKLPAEKW